MSTPNGCLYPDSYAYRDEAYADQGDVTKIAVRRRRPRSDEHQTGRALETSVTPRRDRSYRLSP